MLRSTLEQGRVTDLLAGRCVRVVIAAPATLIEPCLDTGGAQ